MADGAVTVAVPQEDLKATVTRQSQNIPVKLNCKMFSSLIHCDAKHTDDLSALIMIVVMGLKVT